MKKSIGVLAVVALGLASVVALWLAGSRPPPTTEDKHSANPLPDLTLTDYEENSVRLRDLTTSRPLIANSWATWCPFCEKELVDFSAIQQEFGDRVQIVAIDRGESLALIKRYTDELGVTDALLVLLDPADSFYTAIGGFAMPETIFVDTQGHIRDHRRGSMPKEEMRARIHTLLAE